MLGFELFTYARHGLGCGMPVSVEQPRRRHCSLLALGTGWERPRLEERLQSESVTHDTPRPIKGPTKAQGPL